MDKSKIIFDISRDDWNYKGIFFGEIDNVTVDKECKPPFPTPKEYLVGVMAIIYIDENEIWHLVARMKFPTGNKHVLRRAFIEKKDKDKTINETYCLQYLYKMPMSKKLWTPNPSGKGWDIVKIIQNLDMIESVKIVNLDEKDT